MNNCTPEMTMLIKRFRLKILDLEPMENLLKGDLEFSDERIEGFIIEALFDINEMTPRTRYTIQKFPQTALLLDGALVQMLVAQGLLQLRNQVSYSDAGLSVNLNDKSGYYAQWLGQISAKYEEGKRRLKASIHPGFRGVNSPMARYY